MMSAVFVLSILLLYPLFPLEKKGILISYLSRSVICLSVCPYVRACVKFLVNGSSPKLFDIATSNFAG